MIKSSLRGLRGKAHLFPNDVSSILQALMDVLDHQIELRARLDALEDMTLDAASAKHALGATSPSPETTDA